MGKEQELKLKVETLKVLDNFQLDNIEGGIEEATSWKCVWDAATIISKALTLVEGAPPPKEGGTNTTQGTEYVLEGGCLLCEVVVGGRAMDPRPNNMELANNVAIGVIEESIGIDIF